jgi:hypothetical protein
MEAPHDEPARDRRHWQWIQRLALLAVEIIIRLHNGL